MKNKTIPSEKVLDSTFSFFQDGYDFIGKRCEKLQTDIFQTRLMAMPVICFSGKEAAALFYDNRYFIRKEATPARMQNILFGREKAQTLDDQIHRQRKEMLMSLMSPEQLEKLILITKAQWQAETLKWEKMERVALMEVSRDLMCRVALRWAGMQIRESDIPARSRELWRLADAFGGTGSGFRKGKSDRSTSERWMMKYISKIRNGTVSAIPGAAAHAISLYHENGKLLDLRTAAVELINILRPTVAISYYITFAALALYSNPQYRKLIRNGNQDYIQWFTQEVRRFYPFAPLIGARVRTDFFWNGYKFPKGRLVLLDIYGTNRDCRIWEKPNEFRPERFKYSQIGEFDVIPLGGGNHYTGHHYAGDWVTVETLKVAVEMLANMDYDIPEQNLNVDLSGMPAFPESHFIIRNVKVSARVSELA